MFGRGKLIRRVFARLAAQCRCNCDACFNGPHCGGPWCNFWS